MKPELIHSDISVNALIVKQQLENQESLSEYIYEFSVNKNFTIAKSEEQQLLQHICKHGLKAVSTYERIKIYQKTASYESLCSLSELSPEKLSSAQALLYVIITRNLKAIPFQILKNTLFIDNTLVCPFDVLSSFVAKDIGALISIKLLVAEKLNQGIFDESFEDAYYCSAMEVAVAYYADEVIAALIHQGFPSVYKDYQGKVQDIFLSAIELDQALSFIATLIELIKPSISQYVKALTLSLDRPYLVEFLFEKCPTLNKHTEHLFHQAISLQQIELVNLFLKANVSVDKKDALGKTAIEYTSFLMPEKSSEEKNIEKLITDKFFSSDLIIHLMKMPPYTFLLKTKIKNYIDSNEGSEIIHLVERMLSIKERYTIRAILLFTIDLAQAKFNTAEKKNGTFNFFKLKNTQEYYQQKLSDLLEKELYQEERKRLLSSSYERI